MSKSVANTILKDHGLEFVKIKTPIGKKCLTSNNKKIKGIFGSSTGPLTATSAPYERLNQTLSSIKESLRYKFKYDELHDAFVISSNSKENTLLKLHVQDFPAYTMDMGYDPMYRSHYIVPHFFTVVPKND